MFYITEEQLTLCKYMYEYPGVLIGVKVKVCFVVFVFSAAESVKSRKVLSLIHICGFIVASVQVKIEP